MSTENVMDEIEAARRTLGQLHSKAQKRLKEVQNQRRGIATERVRVVQATNLVVQGLDDLEAPLIHEEDQLAGAFNPPSEPVAPEPTPEPPAVEPTPTPEPEPEPQTVPPAPVASEPEPEPEIPSFVRQPPSETVAPPVVAREDEVEVDCQPPARTRRLTVVEIIDIRRWRGIEWVGAFIGIVVAMVLWSFWPEWPGRNIDNENARTVVNAIWFVVHLSVGFFGGAIIGAWLEEHRSRDDQS